MCGANQVAPLGLRLGMGTCVCEHYRLQHLPMHRVAFVAKDGWERVLPEATRVEQVVVHTATP